MMRICLRVTTLALAGPLLAWSPAALAYRPFDGTDAAVADPGEMEIELQPAGTIRHDGETTLIAPATVLNFGLPHDWEAVIESQLETPVSSAGPTVLTASGAFLKHVLRPGSLQDQSGPSVATEFGVLLPDSVGETGFGASITGIVSQRSQWGTVHFNLEGSLTRDQRADVFSDLIIEGPATWTVRPVAEFYYEQEFGVFHTLSGLVGAIWQVSDKLSFDVGFRHALVNGSKVDEIRAGLTVGFPLQPLSRNNHK
jgi:hypothetical protein